MNIKLYELQEKMSSLTERLKSEIENRDRKELDLYKWNSNYKTVVAGKEVEARKSQEAVDDTKKQIESLQAQIQELKEEESEDEAVNKLQQKWDKDALRVYRDDEEEEEEERKPNRDEVLFSDCIKSEFRVRIDDYYLMQAINDWAYYMMLIYDIKPKRNGFVCMKELTRQLVLNALYTLPTGDHTFFTFDEVRHRLDDEKRRTAIREAHIDQILGRL